MTTELNIESIQELLEPITTPLGKHSGEQLVYTDSLNEPVSFNFLGAKGALDGEIDVELFNSKDDKDDSRILFSIATNTQEHELSPAIAYHGDSCWLKYSLEANIKGDGHYSLSELGIGIDANEGLLISSYRRHAPTETLGNAVISDVRTFPLIFSVEDVKSIQPEEALEMETSGKLVANAEFAWGEILASSLSTFSKLLDQGEILDIKLDASLSAQLNVSIEGGFKVVFYRQQGDNNVVRIGVKKSSLYEFDGTINAGIKAQLIDPQNFKTAYTAIVEGFFEAPLNKINQILALVNTDDIPDELKFYINKISDRIGLQDGIDTIEDIKENIEQLQKKITDGIIQAAKAKAELSFAYEYNRLTETQSLAELIVSNAALEHVHGHALAGRILDMTAMVNNDSVKLERFFYQKTTKIEKSYGFNLGFGKWQAMSRNNSSIKYVENQNASGEVKLATIAMRGYKDNYFGEKRNFYISFEAQMPDYSLSRVPSINEFKLGLTLVHQKEGIDINPREVQKLADEFAVWQLAPAGELEDATEKLLTTLDGATDIKIARTITVDHQAFIQLLPLLSEFDIHRLSTSFAAALPTAMRLQVGRATPSLKVKYYQPILASYLNGDFSRPDDLAAYAYQYLKKEGMGKLARKERDWRSAGGSMQFHLGGLAKYHGDIRKELKNLCSGMKMLKQAYTTGLSHEVLDDAFYLFDDMGKSELYTRIFGNFLLSCANEFEELAGTLTCSAVIDYKKDGQVQQLVWGMS